MLDKDRPTDEEILKFERMIKDEQTAHLPLVSDLLDFTSIEEEYGSGSLPIYQSKIAYLKKTCLNMRTVRKDGNCFYRAFAFRFCELIRQNYGMPWYDAVISKCAATKDLMLTMGYDMEILADFYEPFEEAVMKCEESELLGRFLTVHTSDTIVCYLRLVTAALLKRDRDIYEAFILDSYPSMDGFISHCVEPSIKILKLVCVESDQIHIVAMANVFGVDIKVANLDTTSSEGINYHEISAMEPIQIDNSPTISLLYRPGHYDVLYPKPL